MTLKRLARRWILRGPLLDRWIARKTGRLARSYQALLIDGLAKPEGPSLPARVRRPGLRRLLFICDVMWERRELLPELRKICEVTFVDVGQWKQPDRDPAAERLKWEPLQENLLAHQHVAFDAVIVYLNSALLFAELFELLRRSWSCPLLGLNLDDKTTFADYQIFHSTATDYRRWAGKFDCNLSNSRNMVDVYRQQGFPCLYLPTGFHFDAQIHRFDPATVFAHKLSFVGSCKPERAALIEELRSRGIPVALFGIGWPDGSFVNNGWAMYRVSQLNLGMGYNVVGHQITNLKNRDFECPGSGGCYLTTYDWELAELFHVGREILCYRGIEDLVELYCYYSRRPEQCRGIARAGFERCVREHTWEMRFRAIFTELGLL
jgi:hypothetical protein